MVDVFLVICTLVGLAILLVISVYLLVYYQHPDDHNEAWVPKIVVILGFVLAGATVLLFPLDVANNEGYAGKCSSCPFGNRASGSVPSGGSESKLVGSQKELSTLVRLQYGSHGMLFSQVARATIRPFAEACPWKSYGT